MSQSWVGTRNFIVIILMYKADKAYDKTSREQYLNHLYARYCGGLVKLKLHCNYIDVQG